MWEIALVARPVYHCNLLKYIENRVPSALWLNRFGQFLKRGLNATGRGCRAAASMNRTRFEHAGFSRDDEGLERKLTIAIPGDRVDTAVNARLQEAAQTIRPNGFRQGKVPLSGKKQIRQRCASGSGWRVNEPDLF